MVCPAEFKHSKLMYRKQLSEHGARENDLRHVNCFTASLPPSAMSIRNRQIKFNNKRDDNSNKSNKLENDTNLVFFFESATSRHSLASGY